MKAQVLREALKISSPLALVSGVDSEQLSLSFHLNLSF